MNQRKNKQHHIALSNDTDTFERVELLKTKLNCKSLGDVIDHYIPKSETEFFEKEFEIFKQNIRVHIPENSQRNELLGYLEIFYLRGIVGGDKLLDVNIDTFKELFGGGTNGKYSEK